MFRSPRLYRSVLFDMLFHKGVQVALHSGPVVPSLGRFQQGDFVPLAVQVVDGEGHPVDPDRAPTATVLDPSSNAVSTEKLAMLGPPGLFGLPWYLGVSVTLGTYTVNYAYTVAEAGGTATVTFDVIPGGDPGGAVLSMFAFDRPEATYVVAQLTSGLLVQGRNPSY